MNMSIPKHVLDNKSKQKDPQNPIYYLSRGLPPRLAHQKAEQIFDENQKKGVKNV